MLFVSVRVCICHTCLRLHLFWQCRLEANYAYQQECDMIPLMMEHPEDFRANGWLGLMLGTRMWCKFNRLSSAMLSRWCR